MNTAADASRFPDREAGGDKSPVAPGGRGRLLDYWFVLVISAAGVLSALVAWWYPSAVSRHYLLFHSLVEMFVVVISIGIFMIAWNSRRFMQSHYFLWTGIAYLSIGVLQLMHALSYHGMGIFPALGNNVPTQLWIAARYTEAIALLLAPLFLVWRLNAWPALAGFAAWTAMLLAAIFVWPIFPAAYDDAAGELTGFKIVSEYVVCGLLVAGMAFLPLANRGQFGRRPMALLIGSMALTAVAEMAFTQYRHPYGPANLFGHLITVLSFFLVYKALIETGLRDPYGVMFNRLRTSEKRYRDLFSQMSEGFALHEVICDKDGRPVDYRFLEINPAFERLTGLKAAETVGRTVLEILPATEPVWIERFGQVAVAGKPDQFANFSAALGRHYQVHAFRPAPRQFAVVFMDVTERVLAAEQLRSLNVELEQRVRELGDANRELETFAHSISHDLRAPLRAIDGFAQALLEDCGRQLDGTGRQHLARIRAGRQRMGELIDGILGLSRVTRATLSRQRVDLGRMAHDVVESLFAADPHRQVEIVIQPEVKADADPHLMRVALENLLGNAWKFTGRTPQARVEFGIWPTGHGQSGASVYFVRDNGAGFDPRFKSKLFGPFQRLHREDEFPGSGIGLATVERVVRRHGGQVRAEGETGKGATIFFTLAQGNGAVVSGGDREV